MQWHFRWSFLSRAAHLIPPAPAASWICCFPGDHNGPTSLFSNKLSRYHVNDLEMHCTLAESTWGLGQGAWQSPLKTVNEIELPALSHSSSSQYKFAQFVKNENKSGQQISTITRACTEEMLVKYLGDKASVLTPRTFFNFCRLKD